MLLPVLRCLSAELGPFSGMKVAWECCHSRLPSSDYWGSIPEAPPCPKTCLCFGDQLSVLAVLAGASGDPVV